MKHDIFNEAWAEEAGKGGGSGDPLPPPFLASSAHASLNIYNLSVSVNKINHETFTRLVKLKVCTL